MDLEQEIWNEQEIAERLGVHKKQLVNLRQKGLPHLRLARGIRVYLAADVLDYVKRIGSTRFTDL